MEQILYHKEVTIQKKNFIHYLELAPFLQKHIKLS